MIGQTISHYKITEKLGEGGMGVVYKAEDSNLKRPVALKFLAAHLLGDEEVKARFRREAEAAAALNHPNICTVHEIAESEGKTFSAMAFLEGEGLDKKIETGPLKLKDALDIAIQTAQGLQAAHEKGIVHRDIKPANLMVTGLGSKQLVTIMDFGLAQLADRSKLTRMDETMGTVTYMSPEQTYGTDLDHRSDIWSLGVVIYEMVTGQQPFKGHYDKAVMYSITNEEPGAITALRTGVPMELEWLVGKCLAKEATERYQTTADMVVDLETLRKKLESGKSTILQAQPVSQAMNAQPTATAQPADHPLVKYRVIEDGQQTGDAVRYVAEDTELRRSVAIRILPQSSEQQIERTQRRKQTVAFGLGALGVLFGLIFTFFPLLSPDPDAETALRRFAIEPSADVRLEPGGMGIHDNFLAVSPNARHIAFVEAGEGGRLWVHDLDQGQARVLEGTEGAISPFWSPDSSFIGFAGARELKRISVRGGIASPVCELPAEHFHGGTWSPDGEVIVFSSGPLAGAHSLYQVSALAGAAALLLAPEDVDHPGSEESTRYLAWAHFLPLEAGARALVFTHGTVTEPTMMVQDLETGQREFLGPGATPVYSGSGHLVYQTSSLTNDLWALPFSLDTLRATGEAFPVAENSRYATVAEDGTLVYLDNLAGSGQEQLVWVDRDGNTVEEIGQPEGSVRNPRLSPDGRRVAYSALQRLNRYVWVWDLARRVKTRLSSAPKGNSDPVWSPRGDEVAFRFGGAGNGDIYLRRADASGEERALLATSKSEVLTDWSRDGKYLLFRQQHPETGGDLWYLQRSEDGSEWEPQPFLQEPSLQGAGTFSPNGRYAAYVSRESGEQEVYVQPFPNGGSKVTVSNGGGHQVRWSRDGKELFYVRGRTLMAVSVSTEGEFSAGSPIELFEHPGLTRGSDRSSYDVSLDGRKFLLATPVGYDPTQASQRAVRVVQNWYEEFRDREQN